MKESLIILLVNAVTTIIVTVVTVRLTMAGRIVSQSSKDKLTSKAKQYGYLLTGVCFVLGSIAMLAYNIRKSEPLTRPDVWLIAFYTGALWVSVILFAIMLALHRSSKK